MRIVEVTSLDALPGLRLAWRAMLNATPSAGFHQTCEWLETVQRHQASPSRLRILLVTSGDETIGILPLVQTERITALGTTRVLASPSDPWSPLGGPLGAQPTATLMTSLRYLLQQEDWDVLELRDVDVASLAYERTRTALEVAGLPFDETAEPAGHVIELPGQWHDDETRPDWARPARSGSGAARVCGQDDLTFEHYRPRGARYGDAEPRWDLFEQCLALRGENPRHAETNQELLRALHASACRSGAADLNVLRRGAQLLACCYNVHAGGTLLTVFAGYISGSPLANDRDSGGDQAAVWQPLVTNMLHENVINHHDRQWLPGSECFYGSWPSSPLRRVHFVHHRQRGARHFARLAGWLRTPLRSAHQRLPGLRLPRRASNNIVPLPPR